jgi:hypothetical protein
LTPAPRMCPGRFLADNSVFMLITSIVATVQISKPKDSHGVKKPFNPQYISAGLVRCVPTNSKQEEHSRVF